MIVADTDWAALDRAWATMQKVVEQLEREKAPPGDRAVLRHPRRRQRRMPVLLAATRPAVRRVNNRTECQRWD